MPPMAHTRSVLLFLLLPALACDECTAQPAADRSDGRIPSLEVFQAGSGSVRVDGRLDDPIWERTGSTGGLVHPGSGKPVPGSRVNGAAWIAWDALHLYLAARIQDGAPETPFSPGEVDPHVWERSSGIELMLQPGDPGDNREYYEIQVDPAGARWSTRFDDYNQPIKPGAAPGVKIFGHQDWDPPLLFGAERTSKGYTLEIALPWSALESKRTAIPPRPGDVWRANVYSFRDGQRDSLAWSPILGQGNFHRASRFGRIVFKGP